MADIAATRTEMAERYVEQILQHIEDQKLVIARLRAEEHNLVKSAEDYLNVLMETLSDAREHLNSVSAASRSTVEELLALSAAYREQPAA